MSSFAFLNWISCGWWNGDWENSIGGDPTCLDLNMNGICDYIDNNTLCSDIEDNGICDIDESSWDHSYEYCNSSFSSFGWDDD